MTSEIVKAGPLALLGSFDLLTFAEADSRAAPVLIDEFDDGQILRAPPAPTSHGCPILERAAASQSNFNLFCAR